MSLYFSFSHSGIGVQSSESRTLQLEFKDKFSLPLVARQTIEGEGNTPVRVALVDVTTKQVVTSGPEASAEVEIVVVMGDFDGDNWTVEEFNKKIVREMEGKKSLLTGNVHLNLEAGVGVVPKISFTHNSNWMKVCKLRLGAKVVDSFNGARVREAVTEPFVLKDYRNTYTKKHFPPSLNDEVWRLQMISKDGPIHNRLVSENIKTVKDFLTRFFVDPQSLQNILGSAKRLESIVDHAQTCILDKSLQLYFPVSSEKKAGVVFNEVGQLMGLISECCYLPIDKLSKDQKVNGEKLVVSALKHREEVKSFNDETLMRSYLQSVNDAYPSNVSIPSLYYCEPSHTQNRHDHTQPSTSSHGNQEVPSDFPNEGIMSSNPSFENASDLNEYGLQNTNVEDLIGDGSGIFPGNSFNPFCESQYSLLIYDDHPFQHLLMNSEAPGLSHFIDDFSSPRAADVAKAHRKWSMLYNVLKSKRKIAALKRVSSEAVPASKRPKNY
ncbi:calmodulin-binding protein 60 A-like isoform X2 [Rhododendron vialii]|uniref:calmodulin-binding protein 60 A-like isoform X2 n=1 Tax=Rhododendron vialii TaxID=182163 RepID=UPI00265EE621|nr:calmodulin-binding protein 60 A-like isoform X2 [Rhododendron vialii]